ncbi:MAG: class I SAM-dependent methyltransferase [Rhizobacter sp.]
MPIDSSQLNVSAPPMSPLQRLIAKQIQTQGGWLPFDRYMALALYAPGLGYYSRDSRKFGVLPSSGSDFVTAPELSPLFGRCLARQVEQALLACGSGEVWEFGAGSGALALQLLDTLGEQVRQYTIIDLSGSLRERQRAVLAPHAHKVRWLDTWPDSLQGVVVGNEVLDAMPVQLLHFDGQQWLERGVVLQTTEGTEHLVWMDRPTPLRPPTDGPFAPGTVTEIHPQAEAFIASLAERLTQGAAFFIDYGFPEAEYYHPQRTGGTLMCHRAHLADTNPLDAPGEKDITAHVNFTGIAVAAQNAGLDVLGYTSQARFLMNCGVMDELENADLKLRVNTQKLLTEHEMGELFKVLGLARGCDASFNQNPIGFAQGDRTHTL